MHQRHTSRPAATNPTRCLPWLDDFAFFVQGQRQEAVEARDRCFGVFDQLGLQRSPGKGQPEPSHCLDDHLGFSIDSVRGEFGVIVRRARKLRTGALQLLTRAARHARRVPAKQLASFAGLAQSSYLALALARCWLRAPFDDLSRQLRWSGEVRLSKQSMADIRQFTCIAARYRRRPI